jgi:hypothetical protein
MHQLYLQGSKFFRAMLQALKPGFKLTILLLSSNLHHILRLPAILLLVDDASSKSFVGAEVQSTFTSLYELSYRSGMERKACY